MDDQRANSLIYRVDLPGGQNRLKEAILYVSGKCQEADRFGLVKLNKTLWKADFDAFRERGQPVTGRQYRRQKKGPVPSEMLPVLNDLLRQGHIIIEDNKVIDYDERRVIPQVSPNLSNFSPSDVGFLDRAIKFYWYFNAEESSDHSHGVAWRTRENGDDMPYNLAYLNDELLPDFDQKYYLSLAKTRGWHSE